MTVIYWFYFTIKIYLIKIALTQEPSPMFFIRSAGYTLALVGFVSLNLS